MARKMLHLGRDLRLPLDAVTETFSFLAKRGAGKTYAASVLVEEMLAAGLVVVVVDPMHAWWGLRSLADGKGAGFEVAILGGPRGDVPLEASGGAVVADLITGERVSCVLDVSEFSKGDRKRFVVDFAERLYQRNREPLHLVLEESDLFAPQRPMRGEERMLGAIEDLVRRGRGKGIGITLITQRSAVLNKDVLTQTECLVALRTTSPQDRAAIEAWIDVHGEKAERDLVISSLPSLPIGEAWFWSPGWLGVLKRIRIRKRKTFDSSATPKTGARSSAPKRLAEIDMGALHKRMAETVERAKENDPVELKRRIAELQHDLRQRGQAEPEVVIERIEVVPEGYLSALDDLVGVTKALDRLSHDLSLARDDTSGVASRLRTFKDQAETTVKQPVAKPVARPSASTRPVRVATPGDSALSKAERSILGALAAFPEGKPKRSIGVLTGYAWKGGAFNNALSSLRVKELITRSEPIRITDEGFTALGSEWEPPPRGLALADYWNSQLGKAERSILQVLVDAWPESVTKDVLGERTDYEPKGGAFNNALSRLRTLELVEGRGEIRAADVLME